jgi:hypothetical protein
LLFLWLKIMQTLRVTIIGLATGMVTLGLAGALLGFALGSVMGNVSVSNAIKVGGPGVVIGLTGGAILGIVVGLLKPSMKGWIAGLIIGLLICGIAGVLLGFSEPHYGARDTLFKALTFGPILGIGGGIIGCVIGAIVDLAFSAFAAER